MLKKIVLFLLVIILAQPTSARTNSEIGAKLYSVAKITEKQNPVRANEMRENIMSFLIDINMLNFRENNAQWKALPTGWLYDKNSLHHYTLRHLGVYKSQNGLIMGVFDVNCQDVNDPQERMFGYVNETEVYFNPYYKVKKGRSKGFYKTFCK